MNKILKVILIIMLSIITLYLLLELGVTAYIAFMYVTA